jgi:hypothetical protein
MRRRTLVIATALAIAVALQLIPAGATAGPLPGLPPTPVSTPLSQALAQLTGTLATECTSSALASNPAMGPVCTQDAEQAGTDAYVYGIPLMEFVRQAQQQTSVTVPNSLSDAPLNQLGSARQLASATPNHQVFVQPNVDTLYTMGHLNLTKGAFVLHVPKIARGLYYEFQFLDPYTNVFAYVGTRTTGDGAHSFLIAGPKFHGKVPKGMRVIRSAYERIWLCGRTLVQSQAALPAVHKIQNGYRLIPLKQFVKHGIAWHPRRPKKVITVHTTVSVPTGIAFYDELGAELALNPPPAADAPVLAELKRIGIGPGLQPSKEHLSQPVLTGLADAANNGYSYLYTTRTTYAAQSALDHDGWFVPFADTGDFGTDYMWRAIVSVFGLAANEPVEAMYIIGVLDQHDQQLNSAHDYVIHFPADALPPARYFWSLTMYDASFYLVPNALNRYALGNRTKTLKYNSDGSLDIYLQHSPPAGHTSNWLPAPASGNFQVTLRLYGPGASALDDSYHYPTIENTSTP